MITSLTRRNAAIAGSVIAVLGALAACGPAHHSHVASPSAVTERCAAGAACTTSTITLGNTSLTVAAQPSQTGQTVSAQLVTGQTLHCPGYVPWGGALAIFSTTGSDASKTVTYSLTGSAAQAATAAYRQHPQYLGCYGSPKAFVGYTGMAHNEAVFVQGDQLYEAQLSACTRSDRLPCFVFEDSGGSAKVGIRAPAGDPRFGN